MYVRHRRHRTTPADPKFTTGTGSFGLAMGWMMAPKGRAHRFLSSAELGMAFEVIRM